MFVMLDFFVYIFFLEIERLNLVTCIIAEIGFAQFMTSLWRLWWAHRGLIVGSSWAHRHWLESRDCANLVAF
jgi:hypothetical protein